MGRKNKIRCAAMVAMLAATVPATASDWKLEAGVTGRETYTDNVGLSATNPQSDFITEVNPYVTASKKGARLDVDFRYTMQNLFYADQSSRNRINHQLAGRAKAELWEKELFLDANASISQQITSLLGPIAADTTSATGNLTDVYTVTVSPYWQHRFGSTANLLARYSHSEVTYSGNEFSNTSTDGINLGLISGSAFNDVFWGLNHSDQQTRYNSNRPDVKFVTTTGTLGYALTSKLRVNGTAGYQDHSYAGATSALSGSIWNVGVAWAPTNRTNLSLGYGGNPIGNSYNFDFRHRTAYTNWAASYNEALSTGSGQFSDIESGFFLQQTPGGAITATPATNTRNILTDTVFLYKRFQASVGYTKGKSNLTLSLYNTIQESQQSGSVTQTFGPSGPFARADTIKQRGANANWSLRLSPVLTSNIGFGISRISYVGNVDSGRRDTHSNIQAGLTRTFNNDLSGSVTLRHQERSSSQSGNDASENAITGSVNYKF